MINKDTVLLQSLVNPFKFYIYPSMDELTFDEEFERYILRPRAHTWPHNSPEDYVVRTDCLNKDRPRTGSSGTTPPVSPGVTDALPYSLFNPISGTVPTSVTKLPSFKSGVGQVSTRKKTVRKNAWGNESYSQLISAAIEASKDKRLSLSQIYDWMVDNVEYFREKKCDGSSAGWKNSIRHNLSLHECFIRIQGGGENKYSYWTFNPQATKMKRKRLASLPRGPRGRKPKEPSPEQGTPNAENTIQESPYPLLSAKLAAITNPTSTHLPNISSPENSVKTCSQPEHAIPENMVVNIKLERQYEDDFCKSITNDITHGNKSCAMANRPESCFGKENFRTDVSIKKEYGDEHYPPEMGSYSYPNKRHRTESCATEPWNRAAGPVLNNFF